MRLWPRVRVQLRSPTFISWHPASIPPLPSFFPLGLRLDLCKILHLDTVPYVSLDSILPFDVNYTYLMTLILCDSESEMAQVSDGRPRLRHFKPSVFDLVIAV